MGLSYPRFSSIAAALALASASAAASKDDMLAHMTTGGYDNRAHGWGGKRRKLKARLKGQQPRRSKAARRARAA